MDWQSSMNQTMNYIENNLTDDIDYSVAAQYLNCSVWEFQRIFSFMAQVPLSEYIRRRRLSMAALDIISGEDKITDIALRYGYDSPASFSRAFSQLHGTSPKSAREYGTTLHFFPRLNFQISLKGVIAKANKKTLHRKSETRIKHIIDLKTLIPCVNLFGGFGDLYFRGLGTQKYWFDNDNLVITMSDNSECMQTLDGYSLPLRIDITAMTTDNEIALYYLMGRLIFNHVHIVNGSKPFIDQDILTGAATYHNKPSIPPNTFVDITWIIEKTYMEVYLNGELYLRRNDMPYINALQKAPEIAKILAPVRISAANDSKITIKSLTITELS